MRTLSLWIIFLFITLQYRHGEGKRTLDNQVTDWEIVFRGVSKSGQYMYNTWNNAVNPSRCRLSYGCIPSNIRISKNAIPRNRHLKSILIDKWICLMIRWVKLEVYKSGRRVAYFVFNGTASSRYNWFDDDRLMENSYSDLPEDSCYSHSYLSYSYKSFMIATKSDVNGYCLTKRGWLQVIDSPTSYSYHRKCDWMKAAFSGYTKWPLILYAKGSRNTIWREQNWELIFRGVSGSQQYLYNALSNAVNPSICTTHYGCIPANVNISFNQTPTRKHLKSILIDKWICLLARWVKIEVYKRGSRVAYFIFNGTATSRTSWFDDDRLMESSYSDMFQDMCYSHSNLYRSYIMSFNIATKPDPNYYCSSKRGWFQVMDYPTTSSYVRRCDWTKAAFPSTTKWPVILYAKRGRNTVWRDREFGIADMIGVYISRVNKEFRA